MFSVNKAIENVKSQAENTIRNIKRLREFEQYINHVWDKHVYLKDYDYKTNMEILHKFSSVFGRYSLLYYYMSDSKLCLKYEFDDLDFFVLFYCNDAEYALTKVSNGKCKITTKNVTEETVVCDL